MITVFTPVYNRAYILTVLYDSLCKQTFSNFEWLIVDDGSSDNLEELISLFVEENKICIRYFKQKNGGKHRAINYGVQLAKGELFFIVDSDDYLPENSLERIAYHYKMIVDDNSFAGVCGLKYYPNGTSVGGEKSFCILDSTSLDFRYKYYYSGDMAEVIKTEVLKEFPFPDFEGERFCAESLLWNRIAQKYKFRYFQESIYICDYLEDGLSFYSVKNRMKSPTYAMLNYSELSRMNIPFKIKLKSYVNYWRFSFCSSYSFVNKIKQINFFSVFLLPFGLLLYFRDLRK